MMVDVVEARPLGGHRLHLRFEDGVEGEIDLAELIRFEGVFAPLQDPARFAEVKVHPELGTVCWPDGADLDPDVLYAKVSGNPIRLLTPGGSELEPASLAPRAHGGRIDTIGLVTSLFGTAPCRTYQRSSTR